MCFIIDWIKGIFGKKEEAVVVQPTPTTPPVLEPPIPPTNLGKYSKQGGQQAMVTYYTVRCKKFNLDCDKVEEARAKLQAML